MRIALLLVLFGAGCVAEIGALEAGRLADAGSVPAADAETSPDREPLPEVRWVGKPCAELEDCPSGNGPLSSLPPTACIRGPNSWPGGYCTEFCPLPADPYQLPRLQRSDCPLGAVCLPRAPFVASNEGVGACVAECSSDADCRTEEGYFCRKSFPRIDAAAPLNFDNGYCAPPHCMSRGCSVGISCEC